MVLLPTILLKLPGSDVVRDPKPEGDDPEIVIPRPEPDPEK